MLIDANRVSVLRPSPRLPLQAYMEDHLRNKDRLQKEWEALCSYQAEPSSVAVAQHPFNIDKNRHAESLPCEFDHMLPFLCLLLSFASRDNDSTHSKGPIYYLVFLSSVTNVTALPKNEKRKKNEKVCNLLKMKIEQIL